jgi:hypothetical protein
MKVVVGNLPKDITEDTVREALSVYAPVDAITLVAESGAPTAVIELPISRAQAEDLAKRIKGRVYEGQQLNAWVPLMGWGS